MDAATKRTNIIDRLDAAQVVDPLRDLDRDRRALLTLLRAARARQRERTAARGAAPEWGRRWGNPRFREFGAARNVPFASDVSEEVGQ
jgi:hypothetical protein